MRRIWITLVLLGILFTGCTEPATEPTVPAETVPTETTQPPTEPSTEPPVELPPIPLAICWEDIPEFTAAEYLTLTGTADPRYPLVFGEEEVYPAADGSFSYHYPLSIGENTVSVQYLDEIWEHTVTRRYTTAWFLHEEGATYCSDATIYAELFARTGSQVEITFRGKTQMPTPSSDQLGFGVPQGFTRYVCTFDSLSNNKQDQDLGSITYRVTCDGITEEFSTGSIICQAAVEMKKSDPGATPEGYRNVGSGFIVEIVDVNAETFDGQTLDDKSIPTMNYLPKGTVDYGTQGVYYNESANRYYYLLRCGVRVYRRNDNKPLGTIPVVDCYNGYLPDHNELNVADFRINGNLTELTLDCLWKAPFFFDQEAQDYYTQDWRRFVLDDYDATYVDITFCYATVFTGVPEIPEDHPLFASAELIQNKSDCTLRLHLKKPGAFYGWNAYYNEAGQLCFRFLNPAKVTPANNAYGADLTGLRIMLDVGHGGQDPGAWYSDSRKTNWYESERNLTLALALKEQLESIGAEVVMNRTDEDYTLTRTERIAYLMEQQPDLCICIHHNADPSSATNGFEAWYFTPFSLDITTTIRDATARTDIYRNSNLSWHYYYVARQTVCPIVLAENGFMSNKKELDKIADPQVILEKARALTQGIVDYYLGIS